MFGISSTLSSMMPLFSTMYIIGRDADFDIPQVRDDLPRRLDLAELEKMLLRMSLGERWCEHTPIQSYASYPAGSITHRLAHLMFLKSMKRELLQQRCVCEGPERVSSHSNGSGSKLKDKNKTLDMSKPKLRRSNAVDFYSEFTADGLTPQDWIFYICHYFSSGFHKWRRVLHLQLTAWF